MLLYSETKQETEPQIETEYLEFDLKIISIMALIVAPQNFCINAGNLKSE